MAMTEQQWKWADLVVKTLGVTIITGAITLYSIQVQQTQRELALETSAAQQQRDRKERQLNALVDFASAQKRLDVDVGMQMFRAFIDKYLDVSVVGAAEIKENMVLLRLIALNFQDVPINLKPLFEDLDARLNRERPEGFVTAAGGATVADRDADALSEDVRAALRLELKTIAKEVANRQAFRLTFLDGALTDFEAVRKGDVRYFDSVPYAIQVHEIHQDSVAVELRETELNDDFLPVIAEAGKRIGPFVISYFDMPILDNIKVNDSTRVAVLLNEAGGDTATIRGVSFRSDLATDRFDVKEMSREIITDLIQEKR